MHNLNFHNIKRLLRWGSYRLALEALLCYSVELVRMDFLTSPAIQIGYAVSPKAETGYYRQDPQLSRYGP